MNQKIKRIIVLCILMSLLIGAVGSTALATEGTTYTRTISSDFSKTIRTQEAYLPAGTYLSDVGLSSPEDLFYHDGGIYIADSGNHRIVVCSTTGELLRVIGEESLEKPTGIAVSDDGTIYVADYRANAVVVLNADGTLRTRIEKPDAAYYGNSVYKPTRLALDRFGNLYVVSEGTNEGMLQFDANGVFGGFFGANKTDGLSLVEWFQKNFYTDVQKDRLFYRVPPSVVSLDTAESGLVYSVTQDDRYNAIKKLNMAGYNINEGDLPVYSADYVDVAVADSGYYLALTEDGFIDEFNEDGLLMLMFGGRAITTDRIGLSAVSSAIDVDEDGNLYVLDKERAILQIWYPTAYAQLLHEANDTFKAGNYEESLSCWQEILRINPAAYMSHEGLARTLFQLGRYEEAAEHYKIIYARKSYSNCYLRIRSGWIRENIRTILICVFTLIVLLSISHLVRKKYDYLRPVNLWWKRKIQTHPLVGQLIDDPLYQIRHPIDGVYYLKIGRRGSLKGAIILYALAFAVYILCRAGTSFVFGGGFTTRNNPAAVSLIVLVPAVLFVIGSYLISSIHDGEGTFRQEFIALGYALSAFILFWPIVMAVSWMLSYTELFQYQFLETLVLGYSAVMIFFAVKETQAYTPKKTFANLLLTLAFMLIAVLAVIVLYILWKELIGFVAEILEEVKYRAFS